MVSMTISASVSLLADSSCTNASINPPEVRPASRTTHLTLEVFAQVEVCFGDLVSAVMTGRPRNRYPRGKIRQISGVQAEDVHVYEVRKWLAEPRVDVSGWSGREQVVDELVGDTFDEWPGLFSPSRRKPPLDGPSPKSVDRRIAGDQRERQIGARAYRTHVELRTAEAVVAQYGSYVALTSYGDGRRAVRQLDVEGRLLAKEVDMFLGERSARTVIER